LGLVKLLFAVLIYYIDCFVPFVTKYVTTSLQKIVFQVHHKQLNCELTKLNQKTVYFLQNDETKYQQDFLLLFWDLRYV